MHATIQKPLDEIISYLQKGEKIFIVGCGNCAEKCRSGGQQETEQMRQRLEQKGINVVGAAATESGKGLCKLALAKTLLTVEHKQQTDEADSFLVLACGQGIHTVIDATEGAKVHPGCDTIFGGETVTDDFITEYCSLCGECIVESTGGLCPLTLCSKGLLNGPCGGSQDGKCEVDADRDCGWVLIFNRLKELGRLQDLYEYREPKNYARSNTPRSLVDINTIPKFRFYGQEHSPVGRNIE